MTALESSVAFTEEDRSALLAATTAVENRDLDSFKAALTHLGRCPTDPRNGDTLTEPYMLANWWLSLTCAAALNHVFGRTWQDSEGANQAAQLISAWNPLEVGDGKSVTALMLSLLAGAKGQLPAEVAGVGPEHLAVAAVLLLAWLEAEHGVDLVAALS